MPRGRGAGLTKRLEYLCERSLVDANATIDDFDTAPRGRVEAQRQAHASNRRELDRIA